jgi:hypothetical protein
MMLSWKTARWSPDRDLGYWASVVVGLQTTTAMMTLGLMPFLGSSGLQFWVLGGALFGAAAIARDEARRRAAPRSPGGA